jgi:acetylornithine/succinyldiaminopimelate/putrescine aminotransferase
MSAKRRDGALDSGAPGCSTGAKMTAAPKPAQAAGSKASGISSPSLSLADLLGADYVRAVCRSKSFLQGEKLAELLALAEEKVDFYPASFAARSDELLPLVGTKVTEGFARSAAGAPTAAFAKATHTAMAPLGGHGCVRIGEDGRAYLASKSEHYHASLGHAFPGYRLLEIAHRLGIGNATHNNTRGHVTRLLEEELVRAANGVARSDRAALDRALASREPRVLNRVLNLETGSLAVEAALKMMLARFHRLDASFPEPAYAGKMPVFLVMAANDGGPQANYHGTTVLTQLLRGLWPGLAAGMERAGLYAVRPVRINDAAHFRATLEESDRGERKVAGFFHEIVLMNYGAIRLDREYLAGAYELCREHDVPVIVDEIQSCIWSPDLFLFREYGLRPDFVSVGKGFPGGEYPASRIIASAPLDNLNQFGALVTNGQEELASLAYLVTIAFAESNAAHTLEVGERYGAELAALAARYPAKIERIEGLRHLSSVFFRSTEDTVKFVTALNAGGIDISAHTYKANCPPSALTKLPLVASHAVVDLVIRRMDQALRTL